MDGKKENIKALFSNTRTRIIIVFTIALIIVTIIIGFVKFSKTMTSFGGTDLSSAPGSIESIPGALNQTAQYAALQEQQNIEQADIAKKHGTSSIPTIIRSQAFGEGVESVGAKHGEGSVGFSTLAQESLQGPKYSLWYQDVEDAGCSRKSIDSAMNVNNATLDEIRKACDCEKLKIAGFGLAELKSVCDCKDLKKIGFAVKEFKQAGYTASDLFQCGFTACEEKSAGFSAKEMKNAGFSAGELKGAGFSAKDIAVAGGIPEGMTLSDIRVEGCSGSGLSKLRSSGVSAVAIRRVSGCSVSQMKLAGFSAQDLKDAGLSSAQLKKAGFSPEALKNAGFSAQDLLNSGFTPKDLAHAGYTPGEIKDAQRVLPLDLKADLQEAGCDVTKLNDLVARGVTAKQIKDNTGCSLDVIKQVDFKPYELLNAGWTAEQLAKAGFPKEAYDDEALKQLGCDSKQLALLREKGISAKRINKINNCSLAQLKTSGFSAQDLVKDGFSPKDLRNAGYADDDIDKAISSLPISSKSRPISRDSSDNCSAESLNTAKENGVSAQTIKDRHGCSVESLKRAGYSPIDLKDAGFSAAELKNAGFDAEDLKNAGFSSTDLHDAGFDQYQLRDAGFNARQLKNAGFSVNSLKKAGFSAQDLKKAGFNAQDLKDVGFDAQNLRKAGFNAQDLKQAGFGALHLKKAGYSDEDLTSAGFSSRDSALAGLEAIDPVRQEPSDLVAIPSLTGDGGKQQKDKEQAENAKKLQEIIAKQQKMQVEQKYKQKIQQRMSVMLSEANQLLQPWRTVAVQQYQGGDKKSDKGEGNDDMLFSGSAPKNRFANDIDSENNSNIPSIRMGDVLFAVIDTAVNSDEPSPILATIVTGPYKGGKLIGSFNLPSNADKMVISFNTLTMPGEPKSFSVSAFAIDPNTGRTALSSEADHHYLERYGSLFASTFLQGFGNAFQSADTTIQVGGTGGVTNTTVQNGIGRSALENAVIGLATVGKAWGQVAQQNMSRPTTVQIYSGTAIGVLFTQDLRMG